MPARQILPQVWFASDIDALKARLRAALKGTDASVQACGVSDDLRASWGFFYTSVMNYVSVPTGFFTTGAEANRGLAYEDELLLWQNRIEQGGCALLVPKYDPNVDVTRDATLSVFKYVAIAAVAVGGAFVVGKVLEVGVNMSKVLPKSR